MARMDDEPEQRPGQLSPNLLFIVWVMAATFLIIYGVIGFGYLSQLLSK